MEAIRYVNALFEKRHSGYLLESLEESDNWHGTFTSLVTRDILNELMIGLSIELTVY